jgi:hypothetical protein
VHRHLRRGGDREPGNAELLIVGSSAARSAFGMTNAPARKVRPAASNSSSAACICTFACVKRNFISTLSVV